MGFRKWRLVSGALVSLILGACANDGVGPENLATGSIPEEALRRPQDEPLALAKMHYLNGSYGSAERAFRTAVEANPRSVEGWLGLAASYDQLRRFDLSERAFDEVIRLQGRTVEVLNNLAYHHMLRGDLRKARILLEEAEGKDPGNQVVAGNMRLLETWKLNGNPEGSDSRIN